MALFDGIDRLRVSLDYHLARHNLLTTNLTQVDTPGFKPLDLERTSFRRQLNVALQTTDPGHLGPTARTEEFKVIEAKGETPGLDENGVSLDREAVKIASNQLRYDAVASLTTSQLGEIAWAANDGRNG